MLIQIQTGDVFYTPFFNSIFEWNNGIFFIYVYDTGLIATNSSFFINYKKEQIFIKL